MLLLVDKPKGMTSHDVVDAIRDITGKDKVGHGGTLDPNATGLLIVGVTRAGTKQLGQFQCDATKTYQGTILLGERTSTLDADGETVELVDTEPIDSQEVVEAVNSFQGTQEQIPPRHSAIKIDGERAYKKAQQGGSPDMPPRIVEILSMDIDEYSFPELVITTTVSSGTYIRSLARDIGQKLDCGAHLKDLRRTAVNNFHVKNAYSLKDITAENWQNIVLKNAST